MSLGKRLKNERESKGWSQLFAAKKLGISNTVLSNYERDYRDPDTETLSQMADLYDVTTDYLLLGVSNNSLDYKQRSGRVSRRHASEADEIVNLPEVQFIMRAKEKMNPKAYAKFLKLMEDAQKAFDDEDD